MTELFAGACRAGTDGVAVPLVCGNSQAWHSAGFVATSYPSFVVIVVAIIAMTDGNVVVAVIAVAVIAVVPVVVAVRAVAMIATPEISWVIVAGKGRHPDARHQADRHGDLHETES
jgi:hypothetical protein